MDNSNQKFENLQVLIAEDDPVMQKMIAGIIEARGGQTKLVNNGKLAWKEIQKSEWRLLITDWNMPGMSGYDLIGNIRTQNNPFYTYIIFITGRAEQTDILRGLEIGADDYITKPFQAQELIARVAIGQRILKFQKELEESKEKLYQLATCDSLTGLLNRRALYKDLDKILEERKKILQPVGLALLDIDHFKKINDSFGHQIGDKVLAEVAKIIESNLRESDIVARWGGEEFCIVFPGLQEDESMKILDRIRAQIEKSVIVLDAKSVKVSVKISGGLAVAFNGKGLYEIDELICQADQALYKAKEIGRNRIAVYNYKSPGTP
jgi:diguanylate cyclase (GGDEF)-like protein